ncbi:hypothetical protein EST38_g10555 [Candolleomyces aberdarensis]|uniref:Uncharacterized protein n=1 Tax=Candolleomyces aberdarensis TaxID=2316362 RepID=A0A4V1Q2J5_9AGAR|nr:hypothetical protein EST38_g10555 [Candolleomyces aberdarensis]
MYLTLFCDYHMCKSVVSATQQPHSGCARSPSSSSVASTVTSRKDGKEDDDIKQSIEQIKAYFVQECERDSFFGFTLSQMPWAKLKTYVTGHGLVISGWPEGVRFPVEYDRTIALTKGNQRKTWKKKTGIQGIGNIQQRALAAACTAKTLWFECLQGDKSLLMDSHTAWIIGACPVDRNLGQRQLYYNGSCTRLKAPGLRKPAPPKTPPSKALNSARTKPTVPSVSTLPSSEVDMDTLTLKALAPPALHSRTIPTAPPPCIKPADTHAPGSLPPNAAATTVPSHAPTPSAPVPSPPAIASTLQTIPENPQAASQPTAPTLPNTAKCPSMEECESLANKWPRGTTPAPGYTPYAMSMMGAMPPIPHMVGPDEPDVHTTNFRHRFSSPSLLEGHFQMPFDYYPSYGYYPQMQPYPIFPASRTLDPENPPNRS